MKKYSFFTAAILGGLILFMAGSGGCSYEATSYVDKREVTAHTGNWAAGVSARNAGDSAQLVVGLCAFDVNAEQLSWKPDHVLALPQGWQKLKLVQAGQKVVVHVDGKVFKTIDPWA